MELAPHTFTALAGLIQAESGIALRPEKSYLLRHRLAPLLRSHRLSGFDQLVQRMQMRTGLEVRQAVINAVAVKETRFFRDQNCFNAIGDRLLPDCARAIGDCAAKGRRRARFWSAAASTGQEAYSLAILAAELAGAHAARSRAPVQFSILASDISDEAIAYARDGRYTDAEVRSGLSTERIRRFFRRDGETRWSACESVRQLLQFRRFNLLRSAEILGPFDLILCRNVLIYFDQPTRRRICQGLYSALCDGGWLVLGSAESLYGLDHRFETIVLEKTVLYRKPRPT